MSRLSIIRSFTLLILSVVSTQLIGQVEFNTLEQEFEPSNHAIGVADINGDFRDDVISLQAPRNIDLLIQTQNKGLAVANKIIIEENDWDWMVLLGDFKNSGIKSVVSSGAYNSVFVTDLLDLQNFEGSSKAIASSNMFAQGANCVDVNHDGFLDLFVCHDDADSRFFMNNGDGTFTRDNSIIDFSLDPAYDGSGNYGSIWTFINDDDLLDLYIAKCRLGATSTEDPRRINQVYLQNEDGTFTRNSEMGLDIGWQSWAADFGDIDNDGDLDAFIINHDSHHQLMENQGDSLFVEIQSFTDLQLNSFDIQGIIEDFDNNGYVDFLIVGGQNSIVWNYGNHEFVLEDSALDVQNAYSAATGDINSDGFIDVFCSFPGGLASNYNKASKLYVNATNDNNHISISLKGVNANAEGVGARVECYSALGKQTRVVSSGEGYGIFNSLTSRFGLGQDTSIDSIIVKWPSGEIQILTDLQINDHVVITEGQCAVSLLNDFEGSVFNVCPDSELVLQNPNSSSALWNQLIETTDSLIVTEAGFYYATSVNADGCVSASPTILVMSAEEEVQPNVVAPIVSACLGDTILLFADSEVITWSNGIMDSVIYINDSGEYSYEGQGVCGIVNSDTVNVEFLFANDVSDADIEVLAEESLLIELVDVNEYEWSFDENFENIVATGPIYQNEELGEDTILFARNLIQLGTREGKAGLDILNDENFVDFDFENIALNFTVHKDLTLNSITVATNIAGPRVLLIEHQGDTIFNQEYILQNGFNKLDLNVELESGMYSISTDINANINLTGFPSPVLSKTTPVSYPIELDEALTIDGASDLGSIYYYFYNWELSVRGNLCYGDPGQFNITFLPSSTDELKTLGIEIYPNPVADLLYLDMAAHSGNLEVFDYTGRIVLQAASNEGINTFNLSAYHPGFYTLKLDLGGDIYLTKFLKL